MSIAEESSRVFMAEASQSLIRGFVSLRNYLRKYIWRASLVYVSVIMVTASAVILEQDHCPRWLLHTFDAARIRLAVLSAFEPHRTAQLVLFGAAVACTTVVFLSAIRMAALRLLLSYQGWLYLLPGQKSSFLMPWAAAVRLFMTSRPSLYTYQHCLPRQPVPPLKGTIERFLLSMRPVLDKDEMADLERKAKEFESGLGPQLQRVLWLRSWWTTNYVTDWWEQHVYLASRSPIPLSSNYFGYDQAEHLPTHLPAARAAGLSWTLLNFNEQIEREELQPIILRDIIPVCMEQYKRLFGTTRIPGSDVDRLVHTDKSRHIVILYHGQFFKVSIVDRRGRRVSPLDLQRQFEDIMKQVDADWSSGDWRESPASRVAAMTGADRSVWNRIRHRLLKDPTNEETLATIESALFFVTFSDASPTTPEQRGKEYFVSEGSNMWFDKSFSLVICANGRAGIVVEHSWGDGAVPCHLLEYGFPHEDDFLGTYNPDGQCAPRTDVDNVDWSVRKKQLRSPSKLHWTIEAGVAMEIDRSCAALTASIADLDLAAERFHGYGKCVIGKQFKLGPNSFIQMVIQGAYYRDSGGKTVLTYESGTTRLFRHGRTETIRSASEESAAAVHAMESDNLSAMEKYRRLKKAVDGHQMKTRDAASGKGIDRHLFALYVVSKGTKKESEFLNQALSYPWILSTSQPPFKQVPGQFDHDDPKKFPRQSLGAGFAPVVDDGYGITYQLSGSVVMNFCVTSKVSSQRTNSQRLLKHIFDVLCDWQMIIKDGLEELGQ